MSQRKAGSQRGQATVEAALSLPLTVFLMLGTLQLFLMLQGRIMAEYAAFRAVRAGSVRHGDCQAMTHAAILALLPSFHSFLGGRDVGRERSPAEKLGRAFATYRNNNYHVAGGGPLEGSIVWIVRDSPLRAEVPAPEDTDFDQPESPNRRLEARLIYWYPLNIPFADWVISRMLVAHLGWQAYEAQNPLMPTERARWEQQSVSNLEAEIQMELMRRLDNRHYAIPIHASASLRMMTPARAMYFETQNCPPAPEAL